MRPPCDEGVAAVADWKMSDCDDSGATPDPSDAEFCESMAGPPGTIEGSEGAAISWRRESSRHHFSGSAFLPNTTRPTVSLLNSADAEQARLHSKNNSQKERRPLARNQRISADARKNSPAYCDTTSTAITLPAHARSPAGPR